jgi:hypothetical protein
VRRALRRRRLRGRRADACRRRRALGTTKHQISGWLANSGPSGARHATALKHAYAYMQSVDVGQRFVLLMTDGEPTTHSPRSRSGLHDPESNIKCGQLADIEAERSRRPPQPPQ